MGRILFGIGLMLALSTASTAQMVVINEICPANADINYDPHYLNFSGWVELYNKSAVSLNIGGYFLSDDPASKNKWRIPHNTFIPGKSFVTVWCDGKDAGIHTNFTMDSDGEELILSDPSGNIIDSIIFPKQFTNISFGRTKDGGPAWAYLADPTPGAGNLGTEQNQPLADPIINVASGRYNGLQTVSVSHPIKNVVLRFTTDGSEPTATSAAYNLPISISKTTTLKVRAYHDAFLPSNTETRTYFISEHDFSLPVVSIATKPEYLWDNFLGIYTDGTNGIPGNCIETPVNWNRDWTRHATFEYFNEAGSRQFLQSVDIRIAGGCSRNSPQKSFAIKARDKYGKNTIDEELFSSKEINQFGGLMLRNSGNDSYSTMFRDALMQNLLVGQMDVDYMAYQPAIFYLNGEYWGIQNLREKIDADYIESNYSVKKDDLDLIETWGLALEGTTEAFTLYMDSLQRIDRTDPESFQFIDRHIDVQEYINYLSAEIYYCNTDWPGNNVKFWRQRSTNGRFRWILWDLDFGFALYTNFSYATHPTLEFVTDASNNSWPNPAWATLHTRLLLENPIFRNRFIQTLTTAMSTTFAPQRVTESINAFQEKLRAEIPYHLQRWGQSMAGWNGEVERMRNFSIERNDFMKSHVADFFGLKEQVTMKFDAYPADGGAVDFNGVVTPAAQEVAYFKGLPYQVSPIPSPGFAFVEWKIKKRESTSLKLITKDTPWRYFDQGYTPDASWNDWTYNDTGWPMGTAQLGYGDGDEETLVSFGGNPNDKYITTYFRTSISVPDTTGIEDLTARVLYDDGVVVYLNGIEIYRGNMPGGTVSYGTLSVQAIPTENVFTSFVIPKGMLKPGTNVIAAEVHQTSPQSSDISFDFELATAILGAEINFTSTSVPLQDTALANVELEAVFESVQPLQDIVINEFSAAPSKIKDEFDEVGDWIELHNTGSSPVNLDGLYLTDNPRSPTKYKIHQGKGTETVLPAGGYKVLWADDDTQQGPLHLNFKLSEEGEFIGLYQRVGYTINTLDEITFGPQPETLSFSRIPNASGPFLLTGTPTPGSANVFEIPTAIENNPEDAIVLFPNPTDGSFYLKSTTPINGLRIYDSQGTLLAKFNTVDNDQPITLPHGSQGIYMLVIQVGKSTLLRKIFKR